MGVLPSNADPNPAYEVIHQPRYSLFTHIDDVLLLGKGGRTAYIGPTTGQRMLTWA